MKNRSVYMAGDGTQSGEIEGAMFSRAVCAPFTHVIWTAAAGAALWPVNDENDFAFPMFGSWKFLRILLLVVGLHFLWRSSLVVPLAGYP